MNIRLAEDDTILLRRVAIGGEPVEPSACEWLLQSLLANRDNVVTKEQIAQTWAADGTGAGNGNGYLLGADGKSTSAVLAKCSGGAWRNLVSKRVDGGWRS
jgi:hypothetical protein